MTTVSWVAVTPWFRRPLRTCKSPRPCVLCEQTIAAGQRCRGNRSSYSAHEACATAADDAGKADREAEQAAMGAFIRATRDVPIKP